MARHLVHFYLEGGHELVFEAEELSYRVSEDDGTIASYTIKTVPEEELSTLYINPGAIQGIKSQLLEADEPVESDLD